MYCFFKTTTTNKRSFLELQPMVFQLQQHELQVIQNAEKLRNQIILGNFEIIPIYFSTFFNNLANSKQIIPLPSLIRISTNCKQFFVEISINQEAFEIDYLMLIYTFCCESLYHSIQQIKNIRQAIIDDRLPNPVDVDFILDKLKAAYAQIKHAQMNFNSFLPNLCKERTQEFQEFTFSFFTRFSTYIIVMTNLFYFEKLKETNTYQNLIKRQNLCSTMLNLLISIRNLGSDRLGIYLYYLSFYFKCLGYKCIIDRYLYQMQQNDYGDKSYTVMSLEILELSQELKEICSKILVTKDLNEDYIDIFKIQAQRWVEFSDTQIRVYSVIRKNQQIQPNESILLNSGRFNYLD